MKKLLYISFLFAITAQAQTEQYIGTPNNWLRVRGGLKVVNMTWNGNPSALMTTYDTLTKKFGTMPIPTGGGSGINNANIGSGYRWLKPATQEIKTLFAGDRIVIDSTTNPDGLTITSTGADNIYNTNGSLTSNRTVSGGTNLGVTFTNNNNSVSGFPLSAYNQGAGSGFYAASLGGGWGAQIESFNTSNNTSLAVLNITRVNSGTSANGIGAEIIYSIQNSTGSTHTSNRLRSKWTDVTHASRVSQFEITGYDNAVESTLFTLKGSGQLQFNKYGINTFSGTPAYYLGVDASGNVVEAAGTGGGGGGGDMSKATYDANTNNIVDNSEALQGNNSAYHLNRTNHTGTQAQNTIVNLTTDLAAKVTGNAAITGATKTKITYDTKGLVTAGADLADTDIPTLPQSKITNLASDLAGKQATLVSGTNIKTINGASVLGSGDLTVTGGATMLRLTADVQSNATANALTPLNTFTITGVAGENYYFYAYVTFTSNNTTTGSRWTVVTTGTTVLQYKSDYSLTATTRTVNYDLNAHQLPAASNATSGATASNSAIVEGNVSFTTNGTLIINFASEVAGAGNITAKANVSTFSYQKTSN